MSNEIELKTEETSGKNTHVDWTQEHEQILIEWADKAMCYRWLHSKANMLYSYLNTWYTIPVIIISTLTGTGNFAQDRVPLEYQAYFVMLIGSLNLLAGIITTIQQFLKITQLNEAHRVSSISWDKFYRNIKIELAKHPQERIDVKHMIKTSKEEYDRLMETSPAIPEEIIKKFKQNFNNTETFLKIIKPEICDILIPTDDFRNQWFNEEHQLKNHRDQLKITMTNDMKQKQVVASNNKVVDDFRSLFVQLNNREPMENEIIDNLKNNIALDVLQKIIEDHKIEHAV
jgi:hypothetical protein